MPTIEQNLQAWNNRDWAALEDKWSRPFGSAAAQWFVSLLPRICRFLPARTILEIAPGSGRWTRFLADHCQRLVAVDLSEQCVRLSRERFAGRPGISVFQNDGYSLDMIDDDSLDFVFSFDSLVHAEIEVLRGYLMQLKRKLRPAGAGFIHHSNLKAHRIEGASQEWPGGLETHWRGASVGAQDVEAACRDAGLACLVQEIVPWGAQDYTIDCFTTFAQPASTGGRTLIRLVNPDFKREGTLARFISDTYLRDF